MTDDEICNLIIVKNAKFPKNQTDVLVVKSKSAKNADGFSVKMCFVCDDLYILVHNFFGNDCVIIPNATKFSALDIVHRLELGIGIRVYEMIKVRDMVLKFYKQKGLIFNSLYL